jgi:hypothetical protein
VALVEDNVAVLASLGLLRLLGRVGHGDGGESSNDEESDLHVGDVEEFVVVG